MDAFGTLARGAARLTVTLSILLLASCTRLATRLGPVATGDSEDGCYRTAMVHDRRQPALPQGGLVDSLSAALIGTFADRESGFAVPSVRVRLVRIIDGAQWVQHTGADGDFAFQAMPPGTYALSGARTLHRPVTDTIVLRTNTVEARSYRIQAYSHCR
jgi:hypothetical protein